MILISGRGSNLEALVESREKDELGGEIVKVISNRPHAPGLNFAKSKDIETLAIDHKQFHRREAFDRELAACVADEHPDLVILAGFMRILTGEFVSRFERRLMNIHPSLLPLYPGLNAHARALKNRDLYAGATVHYVTTDLDGGPAILQGRVAIRENDDEKTLASRVLTVEHKIYPLAVNWHLSGRLNWQLNRPKLDGRTLPNNGIQWTEGLT